MISRSCCKSITWMLYFRGALAGLPPHTVAASFQFCRLFWLLAKFACRLLVWGPERGKSKQQVQTVLQAALPFDSLCISTRLSTPKYTGRGKSRFTVVHMEKDMQVMFIIIALLFAYCVLCTHNCIILHINCGSHLTYLHTVVHRIHLGTYQLTSCYIFHFRLHFQHILYTFLYTRVGKSRFILACMEKRNN